jgi:hypothetical protein
VPDQRLAGDQPICSDSGLAQRDDRQQAHDARDDGGGFQNPRADQAQGDSFVLYLDHRVQRYGRADAGESHDDLQDAPDEDGSVRSGADDEVRIASHGAVENEKLACGDTALKKEPSVIYSSQSPPDVNLRLVWPQWQGAGTVSVQQLASEFPFDVGRRGYAVGSAVLAAVLPPHDGLTVTAPVTMTDEGLAERDGVEAKAMVVEQLARALEIIRQHNPAGSPPSVESAR